MAIDPLLTESDLAAIYQRTNRWVRYSWRNGVIPQPIMIGSRTVRWLTSEIEADIKRRAAQREGTKIGPVDHDEATA